MYRFLRFNSVLDLNKQVPFTIGDSGLKCSQQGENGSLFSPTSIGSGGMIQELFTQSTNKGVDDHLLEFSEALRSKLCFVLDS